MIDAWVFNFMQALGPEEPDYSDPAVLQRTYDWHMDLCVRAEDLGFKGVFFSEHHFLNLFNPSPNLLVAALAQRTKTLRIGVLGNVLPLHQPWRLAEEIGMLDYLTHGRLEIGYSNGASTGEFAGIGIRPEEVKPLFSEALDVIEAALEREAITHHGQKWNYEDLHITPRSNPRRSGRKWLTVLSEQSAASAAKRGFSVFTGFLSCDRIAPLFDAYRAAAGEAGRSAQPAEMGIRRTIFIADTDAQAETIFKEAHRIQLARFSSTADHALGTAIGKGPHPGTKALSDGARQTGAVDAGSPSTQHVGELFSSEEEFIVGSPRTVTEKIVEQCRKTGAGNIAAMSFPTVEESEFAHSFELWQEVIPILKKTEINARG